MTKEERALLPGMMVKLTELRFRTMAQAHVADKINAHSIPATMRAIIKTIEGESMANLVIFFFLQKHPEMRDEITEIAKEINDVTKEQIREAYEQSALYKTAQAAAASPQSDTTTVQ